MKDVSQECIPEESVRRSIDKLRPLVQIFGVSTYVNEISETVIATPDIREDESGQVFS